MDKQQEFPDDDRAVFVPAEDIQVIERLLRSWERVQQEFLKIEARKRMENGKTTFSVSQLRMES